MKCNTCTGFNVCELSWKNTKEAEECSGFTTDIIQKCEDCEYCKGEYRYAYDGYVWVTGCFHPKKIRVSYWNGRQYTDSGRCSPINCKYFEKRLSSKESLKEPFNIWNPFTWF